VHPLRLLLLISLVVAIAVAWGFSAALQAAGVAHVATIVISASVFVVFLVPWFGVSFWAVRRSTDLERLTTLARRVAADAEAGPVTVRVYHAELDELARSIEELRSTVVRQRAAHDEHRAAMDEIVASLGEGLVAVSPRGVVVVANSRVAEMFAIQGPVVGQPLVVVIRKQPVLTAIERALAGHPSVDRIALGSGETERQIEIRTVPVASSPEIAAVALFIDVTTLERLQRVRRDFLDDFSHEVRTPLTGLRSAAETLDTGGLTAEHERQLRAVMQRQIGRIERLVTDLADLNHIETGQLILKKEPIALRDLLDEICADYRDVAEGVRFSIDGENLSVDGDSSRIQQIFANLLDNAIRHGGGGGVVAVEVRRDGDFALVTVSDNGPGIPADELERIFHRFYRVDRSRSQPGSGLGLAIAKHLVVLHGGSIRACNRTGGATFEVRLPIGLTQGLT
jgi:two-component system phosphate regulon sensor histidine kinase PhoR